MRYLSIYKAAETGVPPTPDHQAQMGKLIEEGCLPTAKGARVRLSDGTFTVTDGPFTESKEVVGGFAILRATSKQHAIEMTEKFLKLVGGGECEIRELYEAPPA